MCVYMFVCKINILMCVDSGKLVVFVFVLIFVVVLRIVLEKCVWDDCVGKNQFTYESR